jgi:hypothetical protein
MFSGIENEFPYNFHTFPPLKLPKLKSFGFVNLL